MLLTMKEVAYLEKYLKSIDGTHLYHCDNPQIIQKKDREILLDKDRQYYEIYGAHLIDNYEDLK